MHGTSERRGCCDASESGNTHNAISLIASDTPTIDTVSYFTPTQMPPPRDSLCLTLTFSQNVTLGEFFGLLLQIPILSPDYQLFATQCWWFCWIVVHTSNRLWTSKLNAEKFTAGPLGDADFSLLMSKNVKGDKAVKKVVSLYHSLLPRAYQRIKETEAALQEARAQKLELRAELDTLTSGFNQVPASKIPELLCQPIIAIGGDSKDTIDWEVGHHVFVD
ncbi:hypothetical protein K439DRAFT_1533931 [Ramaria rubella]|nr:hypothetical protein K439DRAFT_1533931 [Ramaria rubella]